VEHFAARSHGRVLCRSLRARERYVLELERDDIDLARELFDALEVL
jgi:hypothetical protein